MPEFDTPNMTGVKSALKTKIGPIPAWGWGIALLGGVVGFAYLKRKNAGKSGAPFTPTNGGYGPGAIPTNGSGGGSSSGTIPTIPPSVIDPTGRRLDTISPNGIPGVYHYSDDGSRVLIPPPGMSSKELAKYATDHFVKSPSTGMASATYDSNGRLISYTNGELRALVTPNGALEMEIPKTNEVRYSTPATAPRPIQRTVFTSVAAGSASGGILEHEYASTLNTSGWSQRLKDAYRRQGIMV